jgi:organic radical activating enzyme
MNLSLSDIKWVHVEASSKCNAWCPACPRNDHGFGLAEGIVEQDLDPVKFESFISDIPALQGVQFCGNLGDPIAAACITELIDIAKKHAKKIQIHTNGSLRNVTWWKELAHQLIDIDHDVWFGIDGLAGVHEIYRQGTSFDKIIKNATEFINNGGFASWQFIPYKHNEHQIKDCLMLSQQLKFKKFRLAKLYRKQVLAKNYKTGKEFDLLPTESLRHLINIDRQKKTADINNCMHLSMPSIYISANGVISRCCYFTKVDVFQTVSGLLGNIKLDLSDQNCIRNCG